jgi:hypothetical protein
MNIHFGCLLEIMPRAAHFFSATVKLTNKRFSTPRISIGSSFSLLIKARQMPKKTDLSLPGTGRLQKANRLHIHHLEGLECLDCLDLDCDQKKRAPLDQSACRLAIRMPTLVSCLALLPACKAFEIPLAGGEAGLEGCMQLIEIA